MDSKIVCCKCKVPLEVVKTQLTYMGSNVWIELPGCPICGQIFIDEEIVKTKMKEVEYMLEDK